LWTGQKKEQKQQIPENKSPFLKKKLPENLRSITKGITFETTKQLQNENENSYTGPLLIKRNI
jgi:ABC-type Fe3+-citrate transport system substrate-binding protein